MRRLTSILGNSQRLDGGAMFGNAPRAMWEAWYAPDANNRIQLATRALLVEEGERRILFEAGIGAFFSPKLKERFGVIETHHQLLRSLAEVGLGDADIDIIVLSHLHFDHAGGLLSAWQDDASPLELLFPKAQFVVSEPAWQRALTPHPRDRASFIPRLNELLEHSGRLHLVKAGENMSDLLGEGYRFWFSDGHSPGMMLTEIAMPTGPVVFGADLIPGAAWVHLPITMGYDRYPEHVIDEKRELLAYLSQQQGRLFYTHDPNTSLSRVVCDERGRYSASEPQAVLNALEV